MLNTQAHTRARTPFTGEIHLTSDLHSSWCSCHRATLFGCSASSQKTQFTRHFQSWQELIVVHAPCIPVVTWRNYFPWRVCQHDVRLSLLFNKSNYCSYHSRYCSILNPAEPQWVVEDYFIFSPPPLFTQHFSVLIQAVTEPLVCSCFYPEPPQVVLQSLCPINPKVIYVIRTVT